MEEQEALVIDGEAVYAEELFSVLSNGIFRTTNIYALGNFGQMVSGFAPVRNAAGIVVGVVDVNISLNEVIRDINFFTIYLLTQDMEQISTVVQQNSTIAQESAASAEEMAALAEMLSTTASQFHLKEESL